MSKMNLLKVEQQLCLNQRLKHQNCGTCREACPKQAIHIADVTMAITVDGTCNQCGICLRHCPAQAIQWSDIRRYPLRSENGKVEICCRKLKCDGYVECLANLTEYELVYLALHADLSLCVDEVVCKQCTVAVEAEIEILLRNANAFLQKIDGGKIKLIRKEKSVTEQINRRELFGFFFTKMKQSLAEVLPIATEATDYRGLLLTSLAKREIVKDISAAPLFWGLRAKNCGMCGVCVKICKNDALRIMVDEDKAMSRLEHDQSRCSGCGACQKICAHTLCLSPEFSSLLAIVTQKTLVIAEKEMSRCRSCGRLFVGDKDSICDDCTRKQKKKIQAIY